MKMCPMLLCLLLCVCAAAYGLDVGDKAPPLQIQEWIVGEPATPSKPEGETVYVVEFWATWCAPCRTSIPHLNELYLDLKDEGVVIVGISDEPPATIKPFVEEMNMQYRVAADDNGATTRAWTERGRGIPYALIVSKDGTVVWHGHPMAGLEAVLRQVLAGAYDLETSKEMAALEKEFQSAAQANNLDGAIDAVRQQVELLPGDMSRLDMLVRLLRLKEDAGGVIEARRTAAEKIGDSPKPLNDLAMQIVTDNDLESADLGLALDCAQKAARLTAREDADVLNTLARIYYRIGLLDKAIATQKEAISKAHAHKREAYQKMLDYYNSAKALQEKAQQDQE